MKIWSLAYDENEKYNFPQIVYKGVRVITSDEQANLTTKIYKMLKLTHRDRLTDINMIIDNGDELPFKSLYNIVYPGQDPDLEFQTEYMVELLNLFQVEID
jgi:hypothetical protein